MKKRFTFIAAAGLAAAALALPAPKDLPASLMMLSVADGKQSKPLETALAAKGIDANKLNAAQLQQLQQFANEGTAALITSLTNATDYAFGITQNKDHLPDGFVIYCDGDFNAPALIKNFIDSDDFKKALKEIAEDDDDDLKLEASADKTAVTLWIKVPQEARALYPALPADKYGITFKATGPKTLRIADEGNYPGGALAPRAALAAGSPLAALLKTNPAYSRCHIANFDKTAQAIRALIEKGNPDSKEQIAASCEIPAVKALFALTSMDSTSTIRADNGIDWRMTFNAADAATAATIQEQLIAYKVLATSLLAANTEIPKEIKDLLTSLTVNQKDKSATLSLGITFDQLVATIKKFEEMQASMAAGLGCDDPDCDDDDH